MGQLATGGDSTEYPDYLNEQRQNVTLDVTLHWTISRGPLSVPLGPACSILLKVELFQTITQRAKTDPQELSCLRFIPTGLFQGLQDPFALDVI